MKKLLSLILAAALLLSLAACGAPAIPNPPLVLGEKYLTDLDYELALLQFDQAIQIDPKNPRGYLGKADALLHLDRQTDAATALGDGAKAVPRDQREAMQTTQAEVEKSAVDGYIGIATCYEKLGWKEIAIALLRRVCEELPEETRLWEALEGLAGQLGVEIPIATGSPKSKPENELVPPSDLISLPVRVYGISGEPIHEGNGYLSYDAQYENNFMHEPGYYPYTNEAYIGTLEYQFSFVDYSGCATSYKFGDASERDVESIPSWLEQIKSWGATFQNKNSYSHSLQILTRHVNSFKAPQILVILFDENYEYTGYSIIAIEIDWNEYERLVGKPLYRGALIEA